MDETFGDYQVSYATNLQEIEAIRSVWEEMQIYPDSDIDHFLKRTGSSSDFIRPHVILLQKNGKPSAMVVGRIDMRPFALKFGYKKIFSQRVKTFTLIYGGLLGDVSKESCRIIYDEFIRLMKQKEVDIIRINYLKVDSPLYQLVSTVPGFLTRDPFTAPSKHWRMSVPDSIEGFYQSRSRKHRYWLRRMERLLNKDYPDEVTYEYFTKDSSDQDLPRLFEDAEFISSKTYQRSLNVGFRNTEKICHTLTEIARNDGLRACFLYVKGKPCAYWIGQRYGRIFTLFYTGYDPSFRKYELGTIVFIKMLEQLCISKEADHIDFGFGDAPYKSRFGDEEWDESSIHIFAANYRGMGLNMLRMLVMGTHQFSKRMLDKMKLLEKIKGLKKRKPSKKA